jgi:small subunit ribosomal protein S15
MRLCLTGNRLECILLAQKKREKMTTKTELIKKFQQHENDTGSPQVQVALLTERINGLSQHFKSHKKDFHSRQGLLQMVSCRRRLLEYLKQHDETSYRKMLEALDLRK